ncbi:MAG: FAD-binding protein [Betaproteobacteria bacterium]|nr:FAD-binding protein [Betaproteobacteria bacterium]
MSRRKFKFWGWGYADEQVPADERARLTAHVAKRFAVDGFGAETPPPTVAEIALRPSRIRAPGSLSDLLGDDPEDRLIHSYGKSYPDSVRAFARHFPEPPDLVARPRNEAELIAVLDFADSIRAAVVPFGGGSSVVGGVEPAVTQDYAGVITLNMQRLDRVLEVDPVSRSARIQAGVLGPDLESQLRPHGLTLRHFPQSFAFSTLGGWIATRSGGHFATVCTHIDDLVESVRVVTPRDVSESRRLPGSGAGPSPDRLFIGSEGILGVITEAWMRLQRRPQFRAGTAVRFTDWHRAVDAIRMLAQSGLYPSNCRIIDAEEATMTRAGDGSAHVLVLAFENADHPVDAWMARALEIVAEHGGDWNRDAASAADGHRSGESGAWRDAFLRAPYYREVLTANGIMYDTFETAITWERFHELHARVIDATRRAIRDVTGREGSVSCRFTHVYPDGPAPYFSFYALPRRGAELQQWREIKEAASEALLAAGGTITHHHAVGRDHRPWYDRQRPEAFATVLRAAKRALDPNALLNPGVLVDPE